jgi:hypothetical protein
MKWYSAIVLHSQVLPGGSRPQRSTHPINMLPAAVYRVSEADSAPAISDHNYPEDLNPPVVRRPRRPTVEEVRQRHTTRTAPIHPTHRHPSTYLRRFPVWFDFRGNSSVQLSQARRPSQPLPSFARRSSTPKTSRSSRPSGSSAETPSQPASCTAKAMTGLRSTASAPAKSSAPCPSASRPKAPPTHPTGPTYAAAGLIRRSGLSPSGSGSGSCSDLSGPAVVQGVVDRRNQRSP